MFTAIVMIVTVDHVSYNKKYLDPSLPYPLTFKHLSKKQDSKPQKKIVKNKHIEDPQPFNYKEKKMITPPEEKCKKKRK